MIFYKYVIRFIHSTIMFSSYFKMWCSLSFVAVNMFYLNGDSLVFAFPRKPTDNCFYALFYPDTYTHSYFLDADDCMFTLLLEV